MKKSRITIPLLALSITFVQLNVNAATITPRDSGSCFIDTSVKGFPLSLPVETGVFQLISHGRPGELLIEGQWKNAKQIAEFLTSRLTPYISHLNIYGCEFAKGEKGMTAVQYLQQRLHVVIGASINITGKGGDWQLEVGNNVSVLSFPGYTGSLQLSCPPNYGSFVIDSFYAASASGGYANNGSSAGSPDGKGILIYDTPAGIFTYAKTFTGGDSAVITAKYLYATFLDGITLEFSTDNTTYVGLTGTINGFSSSSFVNVKYALPATLTGLYKYIRVKGASSNTELTIDAIQIQDVTCNTCNINVAPALSTTTISNICPATTFNLSTITASNTPAGAILTWHTGTPASAANRIANITAVTTTATKLYAAFYHSGNNCYSGYNGSATAIVTNANDYDCDGVPDTSDIDDDNDGILDAAEAPLCYYTAAESDSVVSVSTPLTIQAGDDINTLKDKNITTATFNFTSQPVANGSPIFDFYTLTSCRLDSVAIDMGATTGITANSSSTAKLQADNGSTWVDLSTGIVIGGPISSGIIYFPVTVNAGNYSHYRIINSTGAGITVNTQAIAEITVSRNDAYYIPSLYPKSSCTTGTDNDGVSNNFDLDSDGDGCSDAKEAGATTSTATNYQFTGAVGANGLANSLETVADNGIINYTSTYSQYAIDASLNFCTDGIIGDRDHPFSVEVDQSKLSFLWKVRSCFIGDTKLFLLFYFKGNFFS
ncbi:MAG: DUF4347 domain-containing protein [Chitinophagaceae bacterium]